MIHRCTSLFFNPYALVIFNENNTPPLLQLISSLMMRLLAGGRDNLSLTWHRPIANDNDPINSIIIQESKINSPLEKMNGFFTSWKLKVAL